MVKKIILGVLVLTSFVSSAQKSETVSVVNNYNDWNWQKVYVAKNPYISVAVVPEAAGRILEYNLGNVPSLWVNPKLTGRSFKPTDEVKQSEWRNFGGYRLVPLPTENCSVDRNGSGKRAKRWPPPAIIGDAPYTVSTGVNKLGLQTIIAKSGVQQLPVPQWNGRNKEFVYADNVEEELQYERSLYIEPKSSLVYINHKLKNVGQNKVERGIMISSQHVSRTKPDLTDGENYVAYVPFSSEYKLPNGEQYQIMSSPDARWRYLNRNRFKLDKNNPSDVEKYYNHGTNWKGEVASGIYEVEYDYNLMAGFHIISSKGWICYVNKTNNTAFVKIMEPYDKSKKYDHGLNMSIFCSGLETGYLETEVKTPLYQLKSGESFDYKEIQGAAKINNTPVLDVNIAGVKTKSLHISKGKLTGAYGVFKEAIAFLIYKNKGKVVKKQKIGNVNPLSPFVVDVAISNEFEVLELLLIDENKKEFLLDKINK